MRRFLPCRTGTVAGRAWSDTNADGRMDADEPALPGTRVVLLDMQKGGEAVSAVEVGEDGLYTFDLLRTGAYALRFILPEGELFADRLAEEGASCVEPVEGQPMRRPPHLTWRWARSGVR